MEKLNDPKFEVKNLQKLNSSDMEGLKGGSGREVTCTPQGNYIDASPEDDSDCPG